MITGEQAAPWEHKDSAKALLGKLGPLKRVVLALLSRDAAQRPRMHDLLSACNGIFSSGHTTTANSQPLR